MTSRELVTKVLNHEPVDRVPRDLWAISGVVQFRKDEYDRLRAEYPMDMTKSPWCYGPGDKVRPMDEKTGEYTDAWGCVWRVGQPGLAGEVKGPAISDWSQLTNYKPPMEVLDNADFSRINPFCAESTLFVRGGTATHPFEQLQFIRGTENALIDLAYGTKELRQLLEMIHEFSCRAMRMTAETDVDAVSFMDDWGSQTALLISPDMWREFFRPMYKDYCDIAHEKGKYVFMHSDGNIEAIYEDLIEVGVNALNSQLFCMNIEGLGEKYGDKITFYGEIDRQKILPFGAAEDVREAVRRVKKALDPSTGGVIAQCEWGLNDPYENIATVYDEWAK
ncbi:uroporphyrinogen decarboxylase family protein [Candidatus Hydrogenedentota bacterium]